MCVLTSVFSECDVLPARQRCDPLPPMSLFRTRNGSYFQFVFWICFRRDLFCFVRFGGLGEEQRACLIILGPKYHFFTPNKLSLSPVVFSLFLRFPGGPRPWKSSQKVIKVYKNEGPTFSAKKQVFGNKCIKNDSPGDTKNGKKQKKNKTKKLVEKLSFVVAKKEQPNMFLNICNVFLIPFREPCARL